MFARAPNLNLAELELLQLLLTSTSITDTARRLRTTQPAVSRSLAQLRQTLGDPLLTRVGRKMELTPHARELLPRLTEVVRASQALFEPAAVFQPKDGRGLITLAASDHVVSAYLGPFFDEVARSAPGMDVRVEAVRAAAVGELIRGELDLAIGPRTPLEGMEQLVLRRFAAERYVCAFRAKNPLSRGRFTLERYLAAEHLAVATERFGSSDVQAALRSLGHERRVSLRLPSFLSVRDRLFRSEAVAVLPDRFVRQAEGLSLRELPFQLAPHELWLAWHPRSTNNARHRWVRERLLKCATA